MDHYALTPGDGAEAFELLFGRVCNFVVAIRYSGRFKGYNATVSRNWRGVCTFSLSKEWLGVSKELQQGCLQTLFAKLFKYPIVDRMYLDMYESFLAHAGTAGAKTHEDIELKDSFDRVVDEYFDGFFDECNLVWGSASVRTLGHYHYGTDTITISTILRGTGELLDFVMYHEMLHKKHKFKAGRSRTTYHSKAFRLDERKFAGFERIEKELERLAHRKRWEG